MPQKNNDEFDANKALKEVHGVIQHPDQFSEIFCNVLKTQVGARNAVKETILELLANDTNAEASIIKILKKIDRGYFQIFMSKMGFGVWSITLIILGALIQVLIKKFFP